MSNYGSINVPAYVRTSRSTKVTFTERKCLKQKKNQKKVTKASFRKYFDFISRFGLPEMSSQITTYQLTILHFMMQTNLAMYVNSVEICP